MSSALPRRRVVRRYPPKGAIDRAVEAVRANGIQLASITVSPDGSIKLSAIDDSAKLPGTLFDEFDKQGRL